MQVFLYKLSENKLVPSEKGDIVVVIENSILRIYDNGGNEISNYSFAFLGDEYIYLKKINELEKLTHIKVDPNLALAYPNLQKRRLKLNQLIGYLFEEYVFNLLSSRYRVERNKEYVKSLPKLELRKHNKPDFLVEDKIAIEAKTGDYNINQIEDYEKKFPLGAIVFPWSGSCKNKKWRCFHYLLKDNDRLFQWIDLYLAK